MKKILLGLFSVVFSVAAVGCSSSDNADDCSNGNIVMVTDTGGINDNSFNEGTYSGVDKLVNESDGVCAKAIESSTEADYTPNLNTAADETPDLVVAAGFKFGESMIDAAKDNPDQNFLLVDMVVMEDGKQLPNVVSALFAEHEGSYLAGVAAGMKAKEDGRDMVGFVGGEESDLINKFAAGYEAGVHSVDENIKVEITYTGSFVDAALGKLEAGKLFDKGAYIIYHAAGGSGNGVISETIERYTNAMDNDKPEDAVWVVGVDEDQYDLGKIEGTDHSVVLTSMVKKVGVASYEVSKQAINGEFPGGELLIFNLENDGVGLPEENPNLSDEILEAVAEAKDSILAGEVVVPETLD